MPRDPFLVGGRAERGPLASEERFSPSRGRWSQRPGMPAGPQPPGPNPTGAAPPQKRVKRDDVIYLATQLAVMVDTGVPLSEALDLVADQTSHPTLKAVTAAIANDVKSGVEFSAAIQKHPKVFSKLFVALMRASEASGKMGEMLQRVSLYMEQEQETRRRIKGAMTYPVCMLVFCFLVVVSLLIFVLPRFEKIYAGKQAVLPLPTRLLLSISRGMVTYWPFLLAAVVLAGVGALLYFRSERGRIFKDRMQISLPIIGKMYRKACIARSMRTMATMVSTGVGMLEGLDITAQVAGNHYYAAVWNGLAERVREGAALSDQLFKCDLIPPTISQMVAAGERTGKLAKVMNRVAGFCEQELRIAVKAVTSMIEPVMIIVMGAVIGGIALALLLPIFRISRVMAR